MEYKNPNENWYYNQRYDSRSNKNMKGCFYSVIVLILTICLCLILFSCKSIQYVPVPEYHSDTVCLTKVQFDSIWQHDSIYLHEYTKGDTVYIERVKWHTKIKEKLLHDTTYISRVDSISVPYPVEKKLTKWQQFKMQAGGIALIICLVVVLLFIIYWLLMLRKQK